MWLDSVTAAMDREYRYRRLIPMTDEQYLDEPSHVIEWTLRIAEARGDRPWDAQRQQQQGGGGRGGDPRAR